MGKYWKESCHHLPVGRFVHPDEFNELGDYARNIGFKNVASGPMVRLSYNADMQAQGKMVGRVAV